MCLWESHTRGCRAGSRRPTGHERLRNDDLDYDVRVNINTVSLCYPHIGHITTIITPGRFIPPSRSPPSSSPHSLAPPFADALLSCCCFIFSSLLCHLLPSAPPCLKHLCQLWLSPLLSSSLSRSAWPTFLHLSSTVSSSGSWSAQREAIYYHNAHNHCKQQTLVVY